MANPWKQMLNLLLDLIYPRHCETCGGIMEENSGYRFLCAQCRARIDFIEHHYCPRCGYPYIGGVTGGRVCSKCEELNPVFQAGRSLLLHRGPGAELVRCIKYQHALYLLPDIEKMVRRFIDLPLYLMGAVLVPVPLWSTRRRERGFNQAEELARVFARIGGGLEVADLLVRERDTGSQTRLSRPERKVNVKNAFALRRGVRIERAVCYILVDDVYTTGSTLNACAAQLVAAGAERVRVLTLAHG